MSKNYYEVLGVDQNATQEEIKKAYIEKAKVHHPDKGGELSDFQLIAHAYDILKNPELKQLYDQTGQDSQLTLEQEIQSILLQLFSQALAVESDICIIEAVNKSLIQGKSTITTNIKNLRDKKKKLRKKRKSIFSKAEVNLVHLLINKELQSITKQIKKHEYDLKVCNLTIKALEDYTEDYKQPVQQDLHIYSSGIFSGISY